MIAKAAATPNSQNRCMNASRVDVEESDDLRDSCCAEVSSTTILYNKRRLVASRAIGHGPGQTSFVSSPEDQTFNGQAQNGLVLANARKALRASLSTTA